MRKGNNNTALFHVGCLISESVAYLGSFFLITKVASNGNCELNKHNAYRVSLFSVQYFKIY
jgi:hypothetical protein